MRHEWRGPDDRRPDLGWEHELGVLILFLVVAWCVGKDAIQSVLH